jgi:hypothetical protein
LGGVRCARRGLGARSRWPPSLCRLADALPRPLRPSPRRLRSCMAGMWWVKRRMMRMVVTRDELSWASSSRSSSCCLDVCRSGIVFPVLYAEMGSVPEGLGVCVICIFQASSCCDCVMCVQSATGLHVVPGASRSSVVEAAWAVAPFHPLLPLGHCLRNALADVCLCDMRFSSIKG